MEKMTEKQPSDVAIGKRIRELRKRSGKTLQELANSVYSLPENKGKERTPQHLGCIERGERTLSSEWAMLLSKIFNVRTEFLLCQDDYETDYDKIVLSAYRSSRDKEKMRKAIEYCLETLGLQFEVILPDIPPKLNDISDDELCSLSQDERKRIIDAYIMKIQYKVQDANRNTLSIISDVEKDHFIEEIYDFIEFKINRLVGNAK